MAKRFFRVLARWASLEGKAAWRHVEEDTIDAPPRPRRLRRFFWGFSLPFSLLRRSVRDPALRPQLVRVLGRQAGITLVVGLTIGGGLRKLGELLAGLAKDGVHIDVGGNLEALGAIVGSLVVAEWVVIALSRQHHDALSMAVAERYGLPVDEVMRDPRVRLDLRWVITRLKRKFQGTLVVGLSALPGLLLLAILDVIIRMPDLIDSALQSGNIELRGLFTSAWMVLVSVYWAAVFILGKTSLAWQQDVGEPFFLRKVASWSERYPGWMRPFRIWARVRVRVKRAALWPPRQSRCC